VNFLRVHYGVYNLNLVEGAEARRNGSNNAGGGGRKEIIHKTHTFDAIFTF
jgi:hypothetical protein